MYRFYEYIRDASPQSKCLSCVFQEAQLNFLTVESIYMNLTFQNCMFITKLSHQRRTLSLVAPKRKELGKQNFERVKVKTKQLKGWVTKMYCHFQSMTRSNIED
jgi:hypothetical protein